METSAGTGNSDPTMRELFAAEVDMHLPVLSEGLLAMEKGRAGNKEFESLMRAAHSIKGAARIVGVDPAVRIAHAMEDCFTAAKEGRISLGSGAVDILLQGVDALQGACLPEPDPEMGEEFLQSLLERITLVREGKVAMAGGASSPRSAAAVTPTAPAAPSPNTLVFPKEWDPRTAESLRLEMCDMFDRMPDRITLDFGRVDHLSVEAVSLLLSFAGEARGAPSVHAIETLRVAPAVRVLFRVLGLDSALAVTE